MEWVVKLEAKSGWGEVETIEVGRLKRRVVGLTAAEVGLTLAEGKDLLGELARLVLQTQMEEFTTCARVCGECMKPLRASYQCLSLQEPMGLCGCLFVTSGGAAAGPMHARAPASAGGIER
jgi:hypothetical protein